jgi:broad specificity phosphatase PhoE
MADRLVIVRHGETEWSLAGKHTGHTDLPLTEHGIEQASALAGKLAGEEFAVVLTSPLRRARETCELAGFSARAQIREELREWDYGEYEGLTTPEIRERNPAWDMWRDGCPGGEPPEQVGARVDRVLNWLGGVDGAALVFAHGHVLRVLTARRLEMEVAAGARFKLEAAALGVLGQEHGLAVIDQWNP